MHELLEQIIKHNLLVQKIYRVVMSTLFRFVGRFVKTDATLVLLSSYGGRQFSDSPRVLFEAMRRDDRFARYRFVWAFNAPDRFNVPGAEKIKIDSPSYFLTALKAKIWITNVNIERGLSFKKKETVYLNTWHGTGPKKCGNAIKSRNDYDFSNVDILCCDGEYLKNIFVECFNASEASLFMCGRPREDELLALSEADGREIRNELKIPAGKKTILYMPTWRDYKHDLPDFRLWREKLGDDYVVLFRAHHFSNGKKAQDGAEDFIIDVTGYGDVNRLYYVADILISDYSSAFLDFGLLGKPMLCFADDYEYFCRTTGLYVDWEKEFPGGVIKDENALLSAIKSMDHRQAQKDTAAFVKKYVTHDVDATAFCLDRLAEKVNAAL